MLVEWQTLESLIIHVACVNEQLDGGLDFELQSFQSRHRVVQVSNWKINDHTGDLRRVLGCHHVGHILEDVSTDNLLLLRVTRLHELFTHEDTHDLTAVALSLVWSWVLLLLWVDQLLWRWWHVHTTWLRHGHLGTVHHHLLIHHAVVLGVRHGVLTLHLVRTRSRHLPVLEVVLWILPLAVLVVILHPLLALMTIVVVLTTHSTFIATELAVVVLDLAHQQTQAGYQLDDILVVALHLALLLLVELGAVPLLLLSLLSLLFWLAEVNLKSASTDCQIIALTAGAGRVTIIETHEAKACFWNQLDRFDLAKVLEVRHELVLGDFRVHILDNKVQEMHAPLKLVSCLLELLLALLLGLELCDKETSLFLLKDFRRILFILNGVEVVEGLLRVFRVLEANKTEVLALFLFITHDAHTYKLTERSEHFTQLIISEILLREIFHIKVGGATLLRGADTIQFGDKLTH